jgi:2,3,4,5-tetrahydropyridine-2-carboxylate N-succinyltransferase
MSQALQTVIDNAWEQRTTLSAAAAPAEVRDAVNHIIDQLDSGKLRVAEKINGQWETHQWIKKAVLLSFRLNDNVPMGAAGDTQYYDKVPTRSPAGAPSRLAASGVRVVPPAVARRGSFHRQERDSDAVLRQHRRLCR